MDNFLLLKLNRAVWISLLEQERIIEAISYFETYQNNLLILQSEKQLKEKVMDEMVQSQTIFLIKMTKIAKDYFDDEDYENALICYTSIFKYSQKDTGCLKNYITCLGKLEQFDLETELIEYLETITPDDINLYKILAEVHSKRNNYKKAVQYLEKYINAKQDNVSAHDYNLLGCYYNSLYSEDTHNTDDVINSVEQFKKASDMDPFSRLFAKNVTIMAAKANDYETGKKYWERVMATNSVTNDDKYDYAAFSIRNGNFEEWHKYFGARFAKENNPTQFPKMPKPEWNGMKDLSSSTLLVYYEQGFGDTFLMWGYFPRLVKLAKHVIFVVQDSIYELLKDNTLGVEIIPKSLANLDKIKFNYYIPSMSIPTALKLTAENISVGEGYIKVREDLVNIFKEKYFNNNKFKIGISFSGSVSGNHTRDISIKEFLPLDKLKNVEIYSLTKDVNDEQFECFKNNKVKNIAKDFKNFEDTAAAIENLDVVITSDNCILNLAGALGKKTLGLFNWHYEFRWFDLTGENVVWLTSVKPIVNDKIDNWAYSMNKAIAEIEKLR